jgi:hypothetical protein
MNFDSLIVSSALCCQAAAGATLRPVTCYLAIFVFRHMHSLTAVPRGIVPDIICVGEGGIDMNKFCGEGWHTRM